MYLDNLIMLFQYLNKIGFEMDYELALQQVLVIIILKYSTIV